MPTATGKDRFGLVVVTIAGEPYVIVDIGMRMLTPRELARAQGFPDTYVLTGTKTSQVARIGNSVCPHVAAAIIKANCVVAVA
jgi:DNA (cytosine-5)-methyltransferase 1